MQLDLQSEEFPATGGIAAEGARRTLGRPRLHPLDVVIRESIQNSLDARISVGETVNYHLEVRELKRTELQCLRNSVFSDPGPANLHLSEVLERDSVSVIVLSDRGTCGLVGPTRPDRIPDENSPRNFIDFFRNVGRLRDGDVGGGTYGFGKASLYVVSEPGTIVVHTRVKVGAKLETRLMAAALGHQYRLPRRGSGIQNFTGRHWWGVDAADVVEPVRGSHADTLARRLGLPGFSDEETGTSIMIIAPLLSSEQSADASLRRQACDQMVQTLRWYCWPHLIAGRRPSLVFSASCDGDAVEMTAVEDDALFRSYISAFKAASSGLSPRTSAQRLMVQDIECLKPHRLLGRLALCRAHLNVRSPHASSDTDSKVVPSGVPSHVALMRGPRLVVRYVRFAPATDGGGLLGVFLADDSLNTTFAEAEPVTHDEWNAESMQDRTARTYVRVALRRIDDAVKEYLAPATSISDSVADLPLAHLARALGAALPGVGGQGAAIQPLPGSGSGGGGGGGGGGGSRVSASVELGEKPRLSFESGEAVATLSLRVKASRSRSPVHFRCVPRVVTAEGGNEKESPVGAPLPRVIRWKFPADSGVDYSGDRFVVPAATVAEGEVTVSVPAGTAISINVVPDKARG